ncbi:MAG: dihydroorotase [Desulfotomaculales bacterium]
MRILIRGGTVVDPEHRTVHKKDVLLVEGRVAELGEDLPADDALVIEAAGRLVTPGLIDMHVHLREPGYEDKETIASGTRAAARGGFTAVVCMANTHPVADTRAVVEYIRERARATGVVHVFPVGAVSKGLEGKELAELAGLREGGAVAFSDDGRPVADSGLMRRAMEYARMLGAPVISHCEDPGLSAGGLMNEGRTAYLLGLPGIPAAAEEVMVAREILLAELTGCPVHIAHVSTAGAVRLIREAKARGVPVTAEATPHHFTLTEEAVEGYNTSAKVNPPLRTAADVAAVREGLADGTIDVIATDHAPHAEEEKDVEFAAAPFGIAGLETAVGLVFTELVHTGVLDLPAAVAKMTVNPARILGLPKGRLVPGADGDVTIIDPRLEVTVDAADLVSKGKNNPFVGRKLVGVPVTTVVAGRIVMLERELKC